jgi:addiction module RelB/DinJ family antitoxin
MSTKTLNTTKKKTSNLVVPIDTDLKKQVQTILNSVGLNQSQLVNALFLEIVRTHKIPLSFDLNDNWANTRKATIEEAEAIEKSIASGIASNNEIELAEQEIGINLSY